MLWPKMKCDILTMPIQACDIEFAPQLSREILHKRKDKLSRYLRSLGESTKPPLPSQPLLAQYSLTDRHDYRRPEGLPFTPERLHDDLNTVIFGTQSLMQYLPWEVTSHLEGELKWLSQQESLSVADQIRLNYLIITTVYAKYVIPHTQEEWLMTEYMQGNINQIHQGVIDFYDPLATEGSSKHSYVCFANLFHREEGGGAQLLSQDYSALRRFCAQYGLPHWLTYDQYDLVEDGITLDLEQYYDLKVLYPISHLLNCAHVFNAVLQLYALPGFDRHENWQAHIYAVNEAIKLVEDNASAGWIWGLVNTRSHLYAVMVYCVGDPFTDGSSTTIRPDLLDFAAHLGIAWDMTSLHRKHRHWQSHRMVPFHSTFNELVTYATTKLRADQKKMVPIPSLPIGATLLRGDYPSLLDAMAVVLTRILYAGKMHVGQCLECGKLFAARAGNTFCPSENDKESPCSQRYRSRNRS
jgi:hypothetical protein